jgi:hypothetical protein
MEEDLDDDDDIPGPYLPPKERAALQRKINEARSAAFDALLRAQRRGEAR